ncbi:NAD(P)-dependent oxidoreductase [Pollutimonas bauzanensis]|uniref:(S)-sulfolactate dehydrogenase n=1 Tax=Pollutimonas bauzanensis TaxID=658167 RepID=A0A1M5LSR0_9BURK|nr:NAD(P)-dependent oxidoreductase [Pollutimonas bauzanensis]SHG68051.1 (S)-sulfolactate dehydrogenase [Pollutimonas bauzanensis]
MMALRVTIATDGFLEPDTMPPMAHELIFVPHSDPAALATALADSDALVSRRVNVSQAFLASAPVSRLRLIQQVGVGVDRIDLAAARARGIAVANTPGAPTTAVIEQTFLLILAQLRDIAGQFQTLHAGRWSDAGDWNNGEIAGRTIGIFGLGSIGRGVATRALAFEARVLACGRASAPPADVPAGVMIVGLPQLLAQSDILVIAAALTPETRGVIDRQKLALMKTSAVLVNIARGAIVDEAALADALKAGRLAGAALDAFTREPLPMESPLRGLPGVVLTPHAGGATRESRDRIWAQMRANLDRLGNGQPLANVVN